MKKNYIKKLFLLDGIGAIISAVMLGVVLVRFESYFGIPVSALYMLAVLPCFFAVYDFYCYFFVEFAFKRYLLAIAIVNILYCIFSLSLAWHHRGLVTSLGWLYIAVEVMIVMVIAVVELKAVE